MNFPTGMSDTSVLLAYFPMVLVTAIVMILTLTSYRNSRLANSFFLLLCYVFCWEACVLIYYAVKDVAVARILYDLKLPFVALASLQLLLFTLKFCKLDDKVPRWAIVALYIVPVVTTLLSVTSTLHPFIRRELIIDTSEAARYTVNRRGIWYWVHAVYCYLVITLSLACVLSHHRRLQQREQKIAYNYLLFAIVIVICTHILAMTGLIRSTLDFTLVGMCVTMLLIYISISISERSGFLVLARDQVFNHIQDLMFIVDANDVLMDTNKAAELWMHSLSLQKVRSFGLLKQSLRKQGVEFTEAESGDGSTDLHIPGKSGRVLNLREHVVTRDGVLLGRYYVLADVTQNRHLIEGLRRTAGMDVMTGLPNRYSLELARMTLDCLQNLPIAIIFGDVNRLKQVNDAYGHEQGDLYLRFCAEVLRDACPPEGQVYRIGGDEFILLIPKCTREAAHDVMRQIEDRCKCATGMLFYPSISLGVSVKTKAEESLSVLIEEADRRMYVQKREQTPQQTP